MTRYEVRLDDMAVEDLEELPPPVRRRLWARLEALAHDPRPPWSKALTGALRGHWRIRVGAYRALYTIDAKTRVVRVWNAGHRNRFYKRAQRLRSRTTD